MLYELRRILPAVAFSYGGHSRMPRWRGILSWINLAILFCERYISNEFRDFAKKCGIKLSMSGKGNCYDNAAMESFFHTLKTEHVAFCNFITRAEATASIFEYIEVFYNRERTHSTLKYVSPLQFEQRYLISSQSRMKLAQPAIEAIINF